MVLFYWKALTASDNHWGYFMLQSRQEQAAVRKPSLAKTILIVQDDAGIGSYLVQAISQETPYHPLLVTDSVRALEVIKHVKPNLLILDYRLPHMNGIELYDRLHSTIGLDGVLAIIMSASFPRDVLVNEIKERNLIAIEGPHDLDDLLNTLKKLLA
jgi:DNA-binding NtrC family response regulator